MPARTRSNRWLIVIPLAGLFCAAAVADEARYTAEGLGTLGGQQNAALAMNDLGVIVGWGETVGKTGGIEQHAIFWEADGLTDLGTLDGFWSEARAVNNARQIVGVATLANGEQHAMYWRDGVMHDLNTRIIGLYQPPVPPTVQFGKYRPAGDKPWPFTGDLGDQLVPKVPAVGTDASQCSAPLQMMIEANAINEDGWIVGCGLVLTDPFVHGILLVSNPAYDSLNPFYDYCDLGQLPKAPDCVAYAVSDEGVVVGMSGQRPFHWQGVIRELDPSVAAGAGLDVNATGDIVGWACETAMAPTPCIWRDGVRWDLVVQPHGHQALGAAYRGAGHRRQGANRRSRNERRRTRARVPAHTDRTSELT